MFNHGSESFLWIWGCVENVMDLFDRESPPQYVSHVGKDVDVDDVDDDIFIVSIFPSFFFQTDLDLGWKF